MGVVAKRIGQTLIVYLDGEFDLHAAGPFKTVVADAFARDERLRHLIIKMSDVTFMDSSGVGAILGRYRDLRERGGRLMVVGLQMPVRKVFDFSGMSRVISVFESEGHALASL